MEFRRAPISDTSIRALPKHEDSRGWLVELFRNDELAAELRPKMGYLSESGPGITRGPHEHRDQTDVFVFLGTAEFRLYLWDARQESLTRGNHDEIEIPAHVPMLVMIPPGIVHAYRNVSQTPGWVLNFPNQLYRGEGKGQEVDEIRHEDDPKSPYRI